MFTILLLFIITENWKQLKCSKTGDWLNIIWQIIMIEYHTDIWHHVEKGLIRWENAHNILLSKKHGLVPVLAKWQIR